MESNAAYQIQALTTSLVNSWAFKEVLDFLCKPEQIHLQVLNRHTYRALQHQIPIVHIKPREVTAESNQRYNGGNNANELYLQLEVPEYFKFFVGLEITIESRDQGWASHPGPWSWVDLGLLDSSSIEVCNRHWIYHNDIASSQWQRRVIKYENKQDDFVDINGERHDRQVETVLKPLIENIQGGHSIGIWLRSLYPGWQCKCRSAKMTLFYF